MAVTLELNVGGHRDGIPAPAVLLRGEEIGNGPLKVLRVVEEPVPVEGKAGGPLRQDIRMIGVRRFPVILKEFRGFGQSIVKVCHTASSTISFPRKSPAIFGSSMPPYIHPAPERTSPVSLER